MRTRHPADVTAFQQRLYDESNRRYACRATSPQGVRAWQKEARPAYLELLGIPRIAEAASGHVPTVQLDDPEQVDGYTRQRGCLETEPHVRTPFTLLTPEGDGPFPLAVTPHGHGFADQYLGIGDDPEDIRAQDGDVAVQAVKRGFQVIAPVTRGIGCNDNAFRIADIAQRHGADCRAHNWHVVIVGRTMIGERVWDLMRLLDWGLALPAVDATRVLMTGNSGGGMATLHAAAADERITLAVPSCAYSNYVSPHGALRHCSCNTIPGILGFGEFWDVAGLVAPRPLLTVNGRFDDLHPVAEVEHAAQRLQAIYTAAGVPDRYEHRFGEGGHRFFADLMWPWIDEHLRQ